MRGKRYNTIAVKHNIEVAHRLFELPGKCEQIHGHSMWVTLEIEGPLNTKGILAGIEYGDLKKIFRGYLDREYDHRLLLNIQDPFAGDLILPHRDSEGNFTEEAQELTLPGLRPCFGDPTTENLSDWILDDMRKYFETQGVLDDLTGLDVVVWETAVNMARSYEVYEEY